MGTSTQPRPTPVVTISMVKAGIAVGVFLVGLGISWKEWEQKLEDKADRKVVEALVAAQQVTNAKVEEEKRIHRHLLCRLSEIRGDSYCDGYRNDR